jgi:ATP-dependent RNA helicase DeaD
MSEAELTPEDLAIALPEMAPAQFVGTFEDLDIPDGIRKGLKDLGYTGPTKVQREVFIPVRRGDDVLVQSKTGSGKTTAFALPMLSSLDPSKKYPQALILCPTRELALQVSAETARLGHPNGLRIATIYGGASMRAQVDALDAGAQVIVGTPGRVKDLHRQGVLRFGNMAFAVLDEADEMLSRGFWDEVTSILEQLPDAVDGKPRQTLLFSATLPDAIERAAKQYLRNPTRVNLSTDTLNVATIRHVLHMENEKWAKPRNFLYALELHKPKSSIVFCNRKDETELVCTYLRRFGYRAEALNGDMPQSKRERTLAKVRSGELDMMVATDVAARGIDISDLGHVFNYDLPEHDEVYVHRVGRTGRIGKRGTAVSLIRGKYLSHLTSLRKTYKVPFEEITLPDEKEILWMQAERLAVQILEDASGVEMEQYRPVAEAMIGRGDVKEILAFLLRTHYAQKPRPAYEADGDDSREARPAREPRAERSERPAPRREERAPRGPAMAAAPRTDGPADDEAPLLSPATNLYVTVGLKDGVTDILALAKYLGELSGVDAAHFTGAGAVRDHSSHIEVDNDVADAVIAGCHGKVKPGPQPVRADAPSAEATAPVRDPLAPVMEGDVAAAADAAPEAPRTIVCERAKSQSSAGGSRRRFDGGGRGRDGGGRGRDGGGRGRDGGGRGRR